MSQEASADLRKLQSAKLIEKLRLSTCLHETIRAYRSTERAPEALAELPAEARAALDGLLRCSACGKLKEIMAYVERAPGPAGKGRNSTVAFCPRCATVDRRSAGAHIDGPEGARANVDFFERASVAYRTRPHLPRGWL